MNNGDQPLKGVRREQKIGLVDRKMLLISGVKDIDRFSENELILSTDLGRLCIRGNGLHINALNAETGDFSANGRVDAMIYTKSAGKKGSLAARLFR